MPEEEVPECILGWLRQQEQHQPAVHRSWDAARQELAEGAQSSHSPLSLDAKSSLSFLKLQVLAAFLPLGR